MSKKKPTVKEEADKLNELISEVMLSAGDCRFIEHDPESYRGMRECILDTGGALADWLDDKADKIEKEENK